jgi:hypothetical protein
MTQELNKKVIDRIRKLLALANCDGSSEAEAQTAMEKAQALLSEHNLNMANLGEAGDEARAKEGISKGVMYEYQRELLGALAGTNFCALWSRKVWTGKGFKQTYTVVGRESNVIAVTSMFEYLNSAMERLVPLASNRERLSRSAISWKTGCGARLEQRLWQRKQEMEKADKAQAEAQKAAAPQPTATGGTPGTGLVVVLQDLHMSEWYANQDYMHGLEPGTTKRRQDEYAETARDWEAEAAAEEAKLTPAQKAAKEAKAAKAQAKTNERYRRQQEVRWSKIDDRAYRAGQQVGSTIGLDRQVNGQGTLKLEG